MARRALLAAAVLVAAGVLLFIPLPVGTTRIVDSVLILRAPQVVFDYVTTPANWPRWHPSSLAVAGAADHPLQVGEQVTEEFLVAGRRGSVVWTVQQRMAPTRWVIDGQVHGGGSGRVTYTLAPDAGGTRFEREFSYRSPNLFFAMLNILTLRSRIEAESADAVRRLKGVLER